MCINLIFDMSRRTRRTLLLPHFATRNTQNRHHSIFAPSLNRLLKPFSDQTPTDAFPPKTHFSLQMFIMPNYTETDMAHSPPATPPPALSNDAFAPPVDIYDLGDMYIIATSLPAVRSSDLEWGYDKENNSLTVKGSYTNPFAHLTDCLMVGERHNGEFHRCIRFPPTVAIDESKIKMHMANGVLEVHLMKKRDFK